MSRFYLTLPDIDYNQDSLSFPDISNSLIDLPEKFNRFGTQQDNPFHCFVDDWRIEAIWRDKYKMISRLFTCRFAVSPDYTVETNYPLAYAFYQVWRSRVVSRYWQDCGLYVIPCLQWSRPEINEYLFQGLQSCDVVAVRSPTRGFLEPWLECANQFLSIHQPKLVLHFGTKNGFDVWPSGINLNLR